MACYVSLNFSPSSIFFSHKELPLTTVTRCAALCPNYRPPSSKFISSFCTSKCATTKSLDSSCRIRIQSKDLFLQFSFIPDITYSPRTLTGYWLGPDSDDGWGFIEAFIDEIP